MRVLTEPCLKEAVEAIGAEFTPFTEYFVRTNRQEEIFFDWQATSPPAALSRTLDNVIFGPARQTAAAVSRALDEAPADAIVVGLAVAGRRRGGRGPRAAHRRPDSLHQHAAGPRSPDRPLPTRTRPPRPTAGSLHAIHVSPHGRSPHRGLGLRPRRTPTAIAAAVRRVLAEPSFRTAAIDIAAQFRDEVAADHLRIALEDLVSEPASPRRMTSTWPAPGQGRRQLGKGPRRCGLQPSRA